MPVTLDATVTVVDGIALVSARITNGEPVARRVRLANRLDGAVLPPRRHGVAEPGWSAEGFVGVVPARDERAIGYACRPAATAATATTATATAPVDDAPAVEVVAVERPDLADHDPLDQVVTDLPDARPPPDVIGTATATAFDGAIDPELRSPPDAHAETSLPSGADRSTRASDSADSEALPPTVRRYLASIAARTSQAETFAEGSVPEATAVLAAGVDPAELPALLAADAAALSRLADRASALAARSAAVDVPTDAMERLA